MKRFCKIVFLLLVLVPQACRESSPKRVERTFPTVTVPGVMTEQQQAASYLASHFWDRFLSPSGGPWISDSLHIAGVRSEALYLAVRDFAICLGLAPNAREALSALPGKIAAFQSVDSLSNVYPRLTDMLRECLYDPNSELRDEDLYGALAAALAASELTPDDMRTSYRFEATMCALNAKGSPARDFRFRDARGRDHRLYDYRTPFTLVLFVNPGCHACEETVELFGGDKARALVDAGTLTIISVYIDEDLDDWRAKASQMPDFWVNGYDPDLIIRRDVIYNVRAIPSVYLLDASHTVLLKDAVPRVAAAALGI
mgnify:FL=1